jgi:hypothetical protein
MIDLILKISFCLGIAGFFILSYVQGFKKDKFTRVTAFGGILVVQVFVIFFAVFFIGSNEKKRARNHFNKLIRRDSLYVNIINQDIDSIERRNLLYILQNNKDIHGHNSSPVETINIQIFSPKDTLTIMLRKDSEIPNEYWVFWPRYSVKTEIGRIEINWDSIQRNHDNFH